mmetsp:Transcript_18681/g.62638  ORF Transcript_18681/g.62638 Transcript_18681/m.62638 type:complete len:97 (-) Transcript_18681:68-358(-)
MPAGTWSCCAKCSGWGRVDGAECTTCSGRPWSYVLKAAEAEDDATPAAWKPCCACAGWGRVDSTKCVACNGRPWSYVLKFALDKPWYMKAAAIAAK